MAAVDRSAVPHVGGFKVGAMVDHFRILRLLGQGGMGAVYLARDTDLGRKVALKVILPERLGTDLSVQRFLQEARTTARFSHPNIVAIHEVGQHGAAPYVALEFVEGESLRRRLLDEPMAPAATMRVGLAVAQALAEAHRHGVTHRDLKPENIMIGRDGRLRVLDFGLATSVPDPATSAYQGDPQSLPDGPSDGTELSTAGPWVGTPAYMAPEQFESKVVGPPADVWALGVILHELVTGFRPYQTRSLMKLALDVTDPTPVPDIGDGAPPELAGLISRCLDKQPGQRLTAEEVAGILSRLVGANRPRSDEDNPFRGLLAFGERQAGWYFGREREILLALERLRDSPVLPIVGPSGAGKSSLAHAGIIPRLRERGRVVVVSMRPGGAPFRALATQLANARRHASSSHHPRPAAGAMGRTASTSPLDVEPSAAGERASVPMSTQDTVASAPDQAPTGASQAGAAPTLPGAGMSEPPAPALLATVASEDGASALGGHTLETAPAADPLPEHPGEAMETPAFKRPESPLAQPAPSVQGVAEISALEAALREHPEQLNLRLTELAEARTCTVILVIDQLEELFGNVGEDGEGVVERFLDAVGSAADDPSIPVRLLFTLRDDFLGAVATGDAMRRALSGVVVVQTPDRSALQETLLGPVASAGYAFEDEGLVSAMLDAVADSKAALPLLQFTASLLWERRDRGRRLLTRRAYDEVGGVRGALAAHADGVLSGLSGDGVRVARDLMLRLVTPDRSRRVLRRGAVLEALGEGAVEVLNRLSASRLLVVRKGDDDEPLVEIAHESLISHWSRLSRWLDESREDLAVLADLEARHDQWERRGRSDFELLRGEALRDAVRIVKRHGTVPERVRRFVRGSETASRRRKSAIRWGVGISMLALVAVAATLFTQKEAAETAQRKAEQQTRRAVQATREVAERNDALILAQARGQLQADPTLAVATLKTLSGSVIAEREILGVAEEAWRRGVAHYVLRGHMNEVRFSDFSPDGRLLVSAGYDNTVRVWDLAGGSHRVLRGHSSEVKFARWSPDGARIFSGGRDGSVRLWTLDGTGRVLGEHDDEITAGAWSPDGRSVASGGEDGTIKLWSIEGDLVRTLRGHVGEVEHLRFQGDGQQLLSSSEDGTVRLWPKGGGSKLEATHAGYVRGCDLNHDGSVVVSGGADGVVRVRKADGAIEQRRLHQHEIRTVQLDRTASHVISASRDGVVSVWNIKTGEQNLLRGHAMVVRDAAVSPDGRWIVSGSDDKSGRLWSLDGSDHQQLRGHERRIRAVTFSRDSKWVATSSSDGTIRVWDARLSGRPVLVGHERSVNHVAFAKGKPLAASVAGPEVRLWDLESGKRWRLGEHSDTARWVAFDPSAERLFSGSRDRTVKVWSVGRRELLKTLDAVEKVYELSITDDGQHVAAFGGGRGVALWSGADYRYTQVALHTDDITALTFELPGLLVSGALDKHVFAWSLRDGRGQKIGVVDGDVTTLAVSADRRHLAAASESGLVRLWRATSYEHVLDIRAHGGPVRQVVLADDVIGTVGYDRAVRLWRYDGRPAGELYGHRGAVTALEFLRDGELVTASEDGTVRLWSRETMRGFELGRVDAPISSLAVDRERRRVAANGSAVIPIWDLAGGEGRTAKQLMSELTTAVLAGEPGRVRGADADVAATPSRVRDDR